MKFVALKECGFDRRYYPGEEIDASVIDASVVHNATDHGFIRKIEEAPVAPEPLVALEPVAKDEPVGEAEAEPEEPKGTGKRGKGKGDA